jgi:type I restriction enzyme M protein
MDLIPPELIVKRYFATDKVKLDELNAAVEFATQAVEEFIEEFSVEEGLLFEELNVEKVTKTLVTAEHRKAKDRDPKGEEAFALDRLLGLLNAEAMEKRNSKSAGANLNEATLAKYGHLTTLDIQNLLIDDKWGSAVEGRIRDEMADLIRRLVCRVAELSARYDETLENLVATADNLQEKVMNHLASMGV